MFAIDPRNVRDIAPDVLDGMGRLRVMPASYYRQTTRTERALFGHLNAIYCLPTEELIEWLAKKIDGRPAIEIGAGNGVIAQALGIPATDSYMQNDPSIASLYAATGQPTVQYGPQVEKLDADEAIKKYEPQVVIGAWVTHKYRAARHDAGGNMFGIDEENILDKCQEYIFIGNRFVHRGKSIWTIPTYELIEPDWLFSRASNGSPDFIAAWSK